jgi:hypothetical protein
VSDIAGLMILIQQLGDEFAALQRTIAQREEEKLNAERALKGRRRAFQDKVKEVTPSEHEAKLMEAELALLKRLVTEHEEAAVNAQRALDSVRAEYEARVQEAVVALGPAVSVLSTHVPGLMRKGV